MSISIKNEFEWSKPKYNTKWSEIWKNKVIRNSSGQFNQSACWIITNEDDLKIGSYYDCYVRHSNKSTIIFPVLFDSKMNEAFNSTKYVSGLCIDELVVENDDLHKKTISYAENVLQKSEFTLDEISFTDCSKILSSKANELNPNDFQTLQTYANDVNINGKFLIKNEDGTYTNDVLASLLVLSCMQWPMRSKYFVQNFPFDFVFISKDKVDFVVKLSLYIYYMTKLWPFKNIVIVDNNDINNVFENHKFANKIWNLSKFILQLKKNTKDHRNSLAQVKVKKANPDLVPKQTRKSYTKAFLLTFKDKCTEKPTNLLEIIVQPGHKPLVNKWQAKPNTSNGNVNEEKVRKCRGYMNKLTEATVDTLLPKILPLLHPSIIDDIIQLIFQKISIDKHFHFIYVRMCKEVQIQCPGFMDKFISKCIDFLTKSQTDSDKHLKVSVTMFLAEMINKTLITHAHVCTALTDLWIETKNVELLFNLLTKLNVINVYRINDVVELMTQFSSDLSNPGRLRFLAIDTIEHINNIKNVELNGQSIVSDEVNISEEIIEDEEIVDEEIVDEEIVDEEIVDEEIVDEEIVDEEIVEEIVEDEIVEEIVDEMIDGEEKNVCADENKSDDCGKNIKNSIPSYINFLMGWMKKVLDDAKCNTTKEFDLFTIDNAFDSLNDFIFNEFSDLYLESMKPYLFHNHNRSNRRLIYLNIYDVFIKSLVLIYPFYPVIVEEIYQKISDDDKRLSEKRLSDNRLSDSTSIKETFCDFRLKLISLEKINNDVLFNNNVTTEDILEFECVKSIINVVRKYNTTNNRKDKYSVSIVCRSDKLYTQCVNFYDFIHILTDCNELSITKIGASKQKIDFNKYLEITQNTIDANIYVEKYRRTVEHSKSRKPKHFKKTDSKPSKKRVHNGKYFPKK